jgi:hypothetical protein
MLMRPLVLTCLCSLAVVAPSQAQDPQVDPGSPAGTEYQLPVDRAREEAGATSGGSKRSGGAQGGGAAGEAPLFGTGVETKRTGFPGGKSPRGKPGTSVRRAPTAGAEPDAGASTPKPVRAQAAAPDGGGGLVTVGVGAAGVLLLGGLAGLAWRRRTTGR